ncbi:MAG: L,D-transpeptidase ErfK/SrfK [Thermoleophilaceae bacterium]|nr:L,D-transpeptidase ErfK/SrfK [Thermoleophilaceae bacterium]
MRHRSFILLASLLFLMIGGAVGVYAFDASKDGQIAKGVTVAGVDVGGLTAKEARAAVAQQVEAPLQRPVKVTWAGHSYTLTAEQAGVRADVAGMVDEALARSRDGSILTRTERNITGGKVHAEIPARVTFRDAAITRLVTRVKAKVERPARDAKVAFSGDGIGKIPGQSGVALRSDDLHSAIRDELVHPTASRTVKARVRKTKAKVAMKDLGSKYPVVLAISRNQRKLRLYKNLRLAHTYDIAVGQVGLETPAGLYHIQNKQVDPAWHVPNSAWAGGLAGKVIPGGAPNNPLKARWMGIFDGAGIHGTSDVASLGSAASHGCVRIAVPDVIALYPQVPVGAPVYIS